MQANAYDIIVVGAGIAGLWLGARLLREGYNVIVIEEDAVGGTQTLASQGMIHGGQKYTLTGTADPAAAAAAQMPARWEACFGGYGDLDLTAVKFTGDDQVMWPAGNLVASAAVFAAAQAVNAGTEKLARDAYPEAFTAVGKKFKGPVYRLPERVLDVKSLVAALSAPLKGRLFKGAAENVRPDGQLTVGDMVLKAQAVIFAGGRGNERALAAMNVAAGLTQRRPLRQVMVKPLAHPLNGHGIIADPKPRATVTSHPLPEGGYVWYLGGGVAEKGASMTEDEALRFARAELSCMFPLIDWREKHWATLSLDRAEPLAENGRLPPGPHIHQRGQVLLAWPVKLTFAPLLADKALDWLRARDIAPESKTPPPNLPPAAPGLFPWETATWKKLDDA